MTKSMKQGRGYTRIGHARKSKSQTNLYPNWVKKRISKLTKSEMTRVYKNKQWGNPKNH